MRRLQSYHAGPTTKAPHRRGGGQQPRRRWEHELRGHVVWLSEQWHEQGYTRQRQGELLHLAPRTLRQWNYDRTQRPNTPVLLGRPVHRAAVEKRNVVLRLLDDLGSATGLPSLRECFPDMLRAELDDLLRRYRRVWRMRHEQAWRVLTWTVPGSVWAMDFTLAPAAVDGQFPYLLAVRDLASSQQLLWLPVDAADSETTCVALMMFFARYGAPLVLKSDNGSAFKAAATQALLRQWQVTALFSPPYYPQYNGAIEAGIGSLTTRTEHQAARHGHAGYWTGDDVAAAQAQANSSARPHGPTGPTPAQLWAGRIPMTATQRQRFAEALVEQRQQAHVDEGQPMYGPWGQKEEAAMERRAIERALVEHDYLLFQRRCIPLPITRKKVARIT